jgi:hypothetical protein
MFSEMKLIIICIAIILKTKMNGLYYNDFSRYINYNLHFSFPNFQKSPKERSYYL